MSEFAKIEIAPGHQNAVQLFRVVSPRTQEGSSYFWQAACPICHKISKAQNIKLMKYETLAGCAHFITLDCSRGQSEMVFTTTFVGLILDAALVPVGALVKDRGSKYDSEGCECIYQKLPASKARPPYPYFKLKEGAKACEDAVCAGRKTTYHERPIGYNGWSFNWHEVTGFVAKRVG